MIQTQLIYCGDNLQKLRDLPDACVERHLEIKRAAREHNLEIIPITVQEILDEEVHIRV